MGAIRTYSDNERAERISGVGVLILYDTQKTISAYHGGYLARTIGQPKVSPAD